MYWSWTIPWTHIGWWVLKSFLESHQNSSHRCLRVVLETSQSHLSVISELSWGQIRVVSEFSLRVRLILESFQSCLRYFESCLRVFSEWYWIRVFWELLQKHLKVIWELFRIYSSNIQQNLKEQNYFGYRKSAKGWFVTTQ